MQLKKTASVCINTFAYEGEFRLSNIQTRGDATQIDNNRKKNICIYILRKNGMNA